MTMEKDPISSHNIIKYINRISKRIHHILNNGFERFAFGKGQFLVLLHIYKSMGITQDRLCTLCGMDRDEMAKAVKRLSDLGYIRKEKDNNDRRIHHIFTTRKAEHIRKDFLHVISTCNDKALQGFSTEEREQVITFMERIYRNIQLPD